MFWVRRLGREPGRLASSTRSWSWLWDGLIVRGRGVMDLWVVSNGFGIGVAVPGGGADGADGCEMAFWPVMTVPSARPAEIWCEKLELMAGMT